YGHCVVSATATAMSSLYLTGIAPSFAAASSNTRNALKVSGARSPSLFILVMFFRSYMLDSLMDMGLRSGEAVCPGRRRIYGYGPTADRNSALGVHPGGVLRVHSLAKSVPMPIAIAKSVTELLGVPDPPKTGRERLVAAAVELFYRRGFGAVGIDQVI